MTLLLCCAHAWAPVAAQERELLLVNGERSAASLESIDGRVAGFSTDQGEVLHPLDSVVRWGQLAQRAARNTVVLRDRSVLVGSPTWTREGSVELVEDQWRIRNDTFRSVELPRQAVHAVWFAAAGEEARWSKVRSDSAGHAGREDRVWLTSGDVLSGRLTQVQGRRITLEVAGEAIEIEQKQVAAVGLRGAGTADAAQVAVGLSDGSLLYANGVNLSGGSLSLTLPHAEAPLSGTAKGLALLQCFGSRVTYLSDLTPLEFRHTPYLDAAWPLAQDQALTGGALQAHGRRFLKGIAMHSAARAVYRLHGRHTRFQAGVAIDHSAGAARPGGSVVFRVYLARKGGFSQAWESPIVRTGDPPQSVSVDVSGAQAIALLVDYADYGDQQDHADWLDARLVE